MSLSQLSQVQPLEDLMGGGGVGEHVQGSHGGLLCSDYLIKAIRKLKLGLLKIIHVQQASNPKGK